jgi:hypothetical protein
MIWKKAVLLAERNGVTLPLMDLLSTESLLDSIGDVTIDRNERSSTCCAQTIAKLPRMTGSYIQ